MSKGLNKALLLGNLGDEPQPKTTESGTTMAIARLATSERYRNKKTNEIETRTEWHNLVFFGKLAEIALKFLHKGSQIHVEGRIQTRTYNNAQGDERKSFEILVNEFIMTGTRPKGADDADVRDDPPF